MFKLIREYFQFSNNELKGAFMLLFLIIIIFVVPRIYFKYKDPSRITDVDFDAWIAEVEYNDSVYVYTQDLKQDSIDTYYGKNNSKKPYKENKNQSKVDPVYFKFNPNTVSYQELIKLGVYGKTASILIKFRDKGAKFYTKEDLTKVYGFDEKLYAKLEDYIIFPEKKQYEKKQNKYFKEKKPFEIVTVELNTSDTTELKKLKGIGSVFAKRIIKYRELLGGYYSKNQLLEVYGFTEELLEKIQDNIIIQDTNLQKININTADFKTLIRHPYISKEETNYILNYRNAILEYTDLNILVEKEIFSQENYNKLKPYLSLTDIPHH